MNPRQKPIVIVLLSSRGSLLATKTPNRTRSYAMHDYNFYTNLNAKRSCAFLCTSCGGTNQKKNEPKNVHCSTGRANQSKGSAKFYASDTSSLLLTATGAGMTVPAIPGHQYCCSRSTPGSCHTISGCFRRRGGALASALSALK